MPKYFFDLHNDIQTVDEEARDLADLAKAKAAALDEAREMVRASAEHGRVDLRHYVAVRDAGGQTVLRVAFEDAVIVVRDGQPV